MCCSDVSRPCGLQFRKLVTAIQNIALTLNRHYPARLYRLYLVDAPAIVHLPVRVRSRAVCATDTLWHRLTLLAALPACCTQKSTGSKQ